MRGDGIIFQVFDYRGARKENLEVLRVIIEPTPYGPKLYYNVDRLYPGEGIWVLDNVITQAQLADRVTLKEIGENNKTTAYYAHSSPNVDFIELSFWVELQRKVNNTHFQIENYSRVYENGVAAWYGLYP